MTFLAVKRTNIFDILCIVSMYIFSLQIIFVGLIYRAFASVLVFPYLLYSIKHVNIKNNGIIGFYFFSSVAVVFSLLNITVTSNGLGGSLVLFAGLSLGLYCVNNINKLKIHILIILWINVVYIIYKVVFLGVNPNLVYENLNLSRNHGGMILCLFTGFYCYLKYISNGKGSIMMPFIALLCAYLMMGRSSLGLLSALWLLSIVKTGNKWAFVLFIVTIISVLYNYWEEIQILYDASSFAENGMETSRYKIWKSYFDNLTLKSSILGADTDNIPIIKEYEGNPHNSFLNLHRRLGLLPLILFIVFSIVAMYKYWDNKSYYPFFIMIILYGRIFFDSDCFIGSYDYVLYTMIFYPLIKYRPLFYSIQKSFRNLGLK